MVASGCRVSISSIYKNAPAVIARAFFLCVCLAEFLEFIDATVIGSILLLSRSAIVVDLISEPNEDHSAITTAFVAPFKVAAVGS